LLGLALQDLDEGKSQIAHGETVRETATMVSFMADVIGIRDDMYIGKGHSYMLEVAEAVQQGFAAGALSLGTQPEQRYRRCALCAVPERLRPTTHIT
jgi:ornithine carbamoyltransferase